VGVAEAISGVRWTGDRFAIPDGVSVGDEWDSRAEWRSSRRTLREVRRARATLRETCETPSGPRECLRYELDLTLSDESSSPERAPPTHAHGSEWIAEGLGLVRSTIDDGSGFGPQLRLIATSDP